MPRVLDLPPVPDRPELPPEFHLQGEVPIAIRTEDGVDLEALGRFPPSASLAVVLCHPHPLYGGTMHNAIVLAVAKALIAEKGEGVATLRFNFRGAGRSGGRYDEGRAEVNDARAALSEARILAPGAKVLLAGYSFGSGVGFAAAAADGDVGRVALVAPAVRIFRFVEESRRRFTGKLAVFVGDHDDFCSVEEAEELSKRLSAELTVFSDADHFFLRQRRDVGMAVARFLLSEPV